MRVKFRYRYERAGWIMVAPAILLLTVFGVVPLVMALWNSFHDFTTGAFVGFANYRYILATPEFLRSFGTVTMFAVVITVLQILLSFLYANLVKNLGRRWGVAVRTLVYVPCLFSGYITSIMFRFITNYGGGLISSILFTYGKPAINFAGEGIWPYVSVVVPSLWMTFGYYTLVFYSALINVPRSYYEAAEMDGAGVFSRMFYITLPSLRNYFVLILVGLVTGGMQMFEVPMFMTAGGPLNKTMTPALYMINTVRGDKSYNVIISGAVLMMLLVMAINMVILRIIRSEKSQDA